MPWLEAHPIPCPEGLARAGSSGSQAYLMLFNPTPGRRQIHECSQPRPSQWPRGQQTPPPQSPAGGGVEGGSLVHRKLRCVRRRQSDSVPAEEKRPSGRLRQSDPFTGVLKNTNKVPNKVY